MIREVRPGDDHLVEAWHAVYAAAQTHERPWAAPWQLEELRADLAADNRRRCIRIFAALQGDQVVCAGQIGLPLLDNTTTATVEVSTAVAFRRLGHGRAMLGHLLDTGRAAGRTTFFAEIGYPLEGPADGRGAVGPEFATQHGFSFALGDVQRVLDLPVGAELLDRLTTDAASHHDGYRIEVFRLPVPERWLTTYVALDARVQTDAPTGDLVLEPQAADVAAHRELEALLAAQGRTAYAAVALDAEEEVVAYTCLVAPAAEPARCYQWGTLVHPPHRGHRLGLAVKAANLRQLQHREPARRLLVTFNAEVNAPMVAVNDALGFRPVERLGEFQLRD